MFLDLNDFMKSQQNLLPVSFDIDLSDFDSAFHCVHMEGACKNTAGVTLLKAKITGNCDAVCDRCAEDVQLHLTAVIETAVTPDSSDDDSVTICDGRVDLKKTAYDALVLALPTKILCKENCLGLCPVCGKNRNNESCDCENIADQYEP